MKELGPATEHEVVLAFVRAEIDSTRFGSHYQNVLANSGLNRSRLIDDADLSNTNENHVREELLKAVRGYKANQYLFTGFPADIKWRRIELELLELGRLKYANYPTWVGLSQGTRSVVDGARNVGKMQSVETANIEAVAERIKGGDCFPELIAVQGDDQDLVLVEGHTRATAYTLAKVLSPVACLVGSSPFLKEWKFY